MGSKSPAVPSKSYPASGGDYISHSCRVGPVSYTHLITDLIKHFEQCGTEGLDVACSEELSFTSDEWCSKNEIEPVYYTHLDVYKRQLYLRRCV